MKTPNKADSSSEVIDRWISGITGAMPDDMRNSEEWRALIPDAAGTGREHEDKRGAIITDWMWSTVLPQAQPIADAYGFGLEWRDMCAARTEKAAFAAQSAAAKGVGPAEAWPLAMAAKSAKSAKAAEDVSGWPVKAAARNKAAWAAEAAVWLTEVIAKDHYWRAIDPPGLLRRLINLENGK